METSPQVKAVHFQEHVITYTYRYDQPLSIMQKSPLIDERTNHVTPLEIKRRQLKAELHSINLLRKERRKQKNHGLLQRP